MATSNFQYATKTKLQMQQPLYSLHNAQELLLSAGKRSNLTNF